MAMCIVKPTRYVDWSSRIFPTPRKTRFNEMEYQIPVDSGLQCLDEILHILRKIRRRYREAYNKRTIQKYGRAYKKTF